MNDEQLIECYNFCLKAGWVHETPIETIIKQYNEHLNDFNSYFNLMNKEIKEIKILITEAPPYYPNTFYPNYANRKYFYAINQSLNTPYFKSPYKRFCNPNMKSYNQNLKEIYLIDFAAQGVILLDIWPFPVVQETNLRKRIHKNNNQISFNSYLDNYFHYRFLNVIRMFPNSKIQIYLMAPKFTSIQFLNWGIDKDEIKERMYEFEIPRNIEGISISKDLETFINKIRFDKNKLTNYPIYVDGSGNPNFNNYFNQ